MVRADDIPELEYPEIADGRKRSFLLALETCGTVSKAAIAAGISRSTAFSWRRDDPDFAQAFGHARDAFNDHLLDEMYRRAVVGVDKPITFKGEITDHEIVYSDELLIRLAMARMPALFDRRAHIPPTADTRPLQIAPADAERIVARIDEYIRSQAKPAALPAMPAVLVPTETRLVAPAPVPSSQDPARACEPESAVEEDDLRQSGMVR